MLSHVLGALCVPEFALEGSDLTAHGIIGFCGLIQLSLKLSAGRDDSLGLFLALLQLPLQLFDTCACLIRLWKRNTSQAKRTPHSSIVNYKIIFLLNVGMIPKCYVKYIGKEEGEHSCCMANLVFILFCLFSFIFHLGYKILQLLILLANCLCCVLLFSALERNISYKQMAANKTWSMTYNHVLKKALTFYLAIMRSTETMLQKFGVGKIKKKSFWNKSLMLTNAAFI